MEKKYLRFEEMPSKGVTKIFSVINTSDDCLGVIKWKSSWRRYVYVSNECDYDSKCLIEIVLFIESLMESRKK